LENRKHKIAIVVNAGWNILNFRLDLIKKLQEQGFEVIVMSPDDGYADRLNKLGVSYQPLKWIKRRGTNPIYDVFLLIELIRLFRKNKIDLTLLYTIKPNIYGSLASRISGIPSLATVTGLGYSFLTRKLTSWMVKKLYCIAFRYATHIVFQNKDDQALFEQKKLVRKGKSSVIPGSGVNTAYFYPQAKTGQKKKGVQFLFVGRILYDKGIRELLIAFESLIKRDVNVELVILGSIDENNPSAFGKKELKDWLSKLEHCVHINGKDDVRPYFTNADVVVLPSYREGLPKTILEAMSMEKPIIVSDVPGCRDTIAKKEPVNGYFCRVKDPASLEEQMFKMTQLDDVERERLGKSGRTLVLRKFDQQIINKEYLDKIQSILINRIYE
jgi:glycosyltransferase involved in cell wall biosynthesis